MSDDDDRPQQSRATGEAVLRYHLCWKHRDLDGVMALYHPEIQYHDFFQNRVLGLAELREYVRSGMPRESDEALEHSDRIRLDGNTAFIQYQTTLRGGQGVRLQPQSDFLSAQPGACSEFLTLRQPGALAASAGGAGQGRAAGTY